MAVRSYLHKSKLEILRKRLLAAGWMELPTCGDYEVLRMRLKETTTLYADGVPYMSHDTSRLLLIHNNHRKEHLSFEEKDFALIKYYMEEIQDES